MLKPYTIKFGSCLDHLASLPDQSVDVILTDPPYHLYCGSSDAKGFCGREWDGGDIAFRPETWAAMKRLLKPNGYLMSFGGPKTFHHLVSGVRNAGYHLHGFIPYVYASGFPKSLNIGKMLDKEKRGCPMGKPDPLSPYHGGYKKGTSQGAGASTYLAKKELAKDPQSTIEYDEECKVWLKYGTLIKPAWEGIVVATVKPVKLDIPRILFTRKPSKKERNYGCEHLLWRKLLRSFHAVSKEEYDHLPALEQAKGNIHLTVKSIGALAQLLPSNESLTVLDPFMGSGSTGVAAVSMGHKFIGFDIDITACVVSEARLSFACKEKNERT